MGEFSNNTRASLRFRKGSFPTAHASKQNNRLRIGLRFFSLTPFSRVETTCYTEKRYQQPGRPTDETPFELVWRFEGQLLEDNGVLERIRRRHGKYVIATNELDQNKLGLLEMLAIYKQQSSSVERGFRFLKDPLFFADSLFLKKPSRIMALLMVMGLSLLVYALAEHQIRTQLTERDQTLPDQNGKPTQKPTIRRVFQMMEGIDILIIEQAGFRRRLLLNMNPMADCQLLQQSCPKIIQSSNSGCGMRAVILITVNRLYRKGMSEEELFEITRGNWVIGTRREKAQYAFAVYNGIVRDVYVIKAWNPVISNNPDHKNANRWRFDGTFAHELQRYGGGSTAQYAGLGAQNSIRYPNCSRD